MKILVLNAGSSSQKNCLYELSDTLPDSPLHPLWEAKVDWSRHHGVAAIKINTQGAVLETELETNSRPDVISYLLDTLVSGKTQAIENLAEIDIAGHRVVHGGQDYREATLITPEVKDTILLLSNFAPLHNPANLEGIEAIEQLLPSLPQVAVFDTAFHSQIPLSAAFYPGPYEWFEQGIRRYGFHGISHQYCAHRAATLLNRDLHSLRLVICHLGNGCSLSAIRDGVSIDTTMGFTPLEGLMMGSRCGSIDPGILIYLLRDREVNADKLDEILNYASGLKGISGISQDMRQIKSAIASGNSRAQLAFDMYVHSLRKHIGAMLATLGGLDALVFTGGVGENQAQLRALACESFAFLGLNLDLDKNADSPGDTDIATADSQVRVLIINTQEDWAIATECWKLAQIK
ncbi:acetate kinase [Gloeocapsopsis crepidinum LEGE 06123]|uniref:Acetate kinase n=1 Tax=Gloeocapsopsis crepidinum LEGE 06123 TaxID=588587 RepID=A0ABR9URK8_9CHRO|nr:acetate kinase [Gloeocapsopsis crepidinum]MBE9190924.1 acetate kinase [Gloeocapsopsis crepidinum LEGE 06123]